MFMYVDIYEFVGTAECQLTALLMLPAIPQAANWQQFHVASSSSDRARPSPQSLLQVLAAEAAAPDSDDEGMNMHD